MKRLSLILVLAAALTFAFSGVAYANMAIHGGYLEDTDACAGCHRAHTSFADVGWTDSAGNDHASALLISDAVNTSEFCYACHGDDAPGASTNVLMGVYDAGPSGSTTATIGDIAGGVLIAYDTNSSYGATLNGGGFSAMPVDADAGTFKAASSSHNMDAGVNAPVWGYGAASSESTVDMTCTHCHDPHGSSNYRLLKDSLFTGAVTGGYTVADVPTPFVISAEEGYPLGGWSKHEAGQAEMVDYRPNYTTAEYAQLPGAPDAGKNLSGWCAGCHEVYNTVSAGSSSTYNYDLMGPDAPAGATALGSNDYHRHATNWTLVNGDGTLGAALNTQIVLTDVLPLELRGALSDDDTARADFRAGSANWEYTDYMGCLTCHRAHGTSVEMTGWAEAYMDTNANGDWVPVLQSQPTTNGVDPAFSSAILRADNRGVCERCHNK